MARKVNTTKDRILVASCYVSNGIELHDSGEIDLLILRDQINEAMEIFGEDIRLLIELDLKDSSCWCPTYQCVCSGTPTMSFSVIKPAHEETDEEYATRMLEVKKWRADAPKRKAANAKAKRAREKNKAKKDAKAKVEKEEKALLAKLQAKWGSDGTPTNKE